MQKNACNGGRSRAAAFIHTRNRITPIGLTLCFPRKGPPVIQRTHVSRASNPQWIHNGSTTVYARVCPKRPHSKAITRTPYGMPSAHPRRHAHGIFFLPLGRYCARPPPAPVSESMHLIRLSR